MQGKKLKVCQLDTEPPIQSLSGFSVEMFVTDVIKKGAEWIGQLLVLFSTKEYRMEL